MANSSQKRAIQKYRSRLSERGLARFEVLGLDTDRDLIRSLTRRLAESGPEAARLRASVARTLAGEPPKTGGILAALRCSPLVGADLDLSRPVIDGREIDL
jgi:transposase